jgi:hypothetical protein
VKQVSVERQASAATRGDTPTVRQDDLWPEDKPREAPAPAPPLPHDLDESSHSQASATPQHGPVGRKAYDDTAAGRVDTDKGPVMDDVYHRIVVSEGEAEGEGQRATPARE